jgi:small GTP-binding protein
MVNIKIIISGLDNAGKTSILKVFDKRYDFEQEIKELQPTKKIEYHKTQFLNNTFSFWDMGGQKRYREEYQKDIDSYFANTDLLLYVIDTQESSRFDSTFEYLNKILEYFKKNNMNVPLIVTFHKSDPELKDNKELIENSEILTQKIIEIEQLHKFFQTSIYDVVSIVQLISNTLSIFNEQHLKIYEILETGLIDLECESLILFEQNGIIIGENYSDSIDYEVYVSLMNSIKEHIIQLKKIQEENSELDSQFTQINSSLLSYLHQINIKDQMFYISALIKEEDKAKFLKIFPKFLKKLSKVLKKS